MKPKGFGKKLVFKKQTITNLNDKQLDDIQGAKPPPSVWLSVCATVCDTDCICPTDEQWPTCCGSAFACSC